MNPLTQMANAASRSLVILVKAQIVDQQEVETERFGKE